MAVFHKQQTKSEYIEYMVTFISNSNSSKLTDHDKNLRVMETGGGGGGSGGGMSLGH